MNDRSDRAGGDGLYFEPSGDGMGACIYHANGAIICEAKYDDFGDDPSEPERIMKQLVEMSRASPPSGNAGEAEQMVREGRAITVIIPTGYDSAWDFLHDCGLEAVYAAPPQPAPDAVREATIAECVAVAKAHKGSAAKRRHQMKIKTLPQDQGALDEILTEERGEDIASEIIEREIRALSLSPAPAQSVQTEAPAQSSPCLRYVNDDAEMVCKCVNGKYPEVVDIERRPPTCKAVASHDGECP